MGSKRKYQSKHYMQDIEK
jgi:hypothetical protein